MDKDATKKLISLQIQVDLLEKLEKIAAETDDSISRLIRIAIKDYIKKYENEGK